MLSFAKSTKATVIPVSISRRARRHRMVVPDGRFPRRCRRMMVTPKLRDFDYFGASPPRSLTSRLKSGESRSSLRAIARKLSTVA